jgi:hypothetical protein
MTDVCLLVVTARAIDLIPFKHAEADTDSKSSVLSQGQGVSVSEDAASIGISVDATTPSF